MPASPPDAGQFGRVVAGCLAAAAVLALIGVTANAVGLFGSSIGDRLQYGAVFSIYAMGVVLAAVVALSRSARARAASDAKTGWRVRASDSLGVVAAITAIAASWAVVSALTQKSDSTGLKLGSTDQALARLASASLALAPALVAIAVIVVVARSHAARTRNAAASADAAKAADEIVLTGLTRPTIWCVFAAALVLVALAVDAAFTTNKASLGDRIGRVGLAGSDVTLAFAAFAVIVLVVVTRTLGRRERDGERIVAIAGRIGVFAMVAAAYSVYTIVHAGRPTISTASFIATSWWGRIEGLGNSLAAGAVGAAAAYVARFGETQELRPKPVSDRAGARIVGVLLACAAVSYAAFTAFIVASLTGFPVNELLTQSGSGVLVAVGLALAGALVIASSRPDQGGRSAAHVATEAVVGIVAAAGIAVSGYTICFVLFGRHRSQFSLVAHEGVAQRMDVVGSFLAAILIAAAALHLLARGRKAALDVETEREIEALDLLS